MKYNTNPLVFLTWYQSHCSDLYLAVLSLLVWLLFFFNIASAITTTAAALRCWTSDVIQPSSLGSRLAAAVVKEFHTAQTTATRITTTNIASITVLKLPQRSSWTDLQNCESLNTVGDRMRPHAPLKVSVRLITRSTSCHAPPRAVTRRHAPPRASFLLLTSALGDVICDVICHVICWRHHWPDRWLWPLTFPHGWPF